MAEVSYRYLDRYDVFLDPSFLIENKILEDGVWERPIVDAIEYFVAEGATCIDVGANAGFISLAMAAAVGSTGKVIACEPCSLTYDRLLRNIKLNPGLERIITPVKIALSDSETEYQIFFAGSRGNAYLAPEISPRLGGISADESARSTTLDRLVGSGSLDFLKVDVEGMEYEVIAGAQETIKRERPIIVYEALIKYFDHKKLIDTEILLGELGYYLYGLNLRGKLFRAYYPKYDANIVAIPRERLCRYADIIDQAAKFEILVANRPEHVSLPYFILIVAGTSDWRIIPSEWYGSDRYIVPIVSPQQFSFSFELADGMLYHFVFDIDQGSQDLSGSLSSTNSTQSFRARRVGGYLDFTS